MSIPRDCVLGVDASTTACKVLAFDAAGAIVSEGRAAIGLDNPSLGAWVQDADAWWRAFASAAQRCLAGVDARRLAGLSIANQRETFVVTDRAGAPLAPALVWMDHRCEADVANAVRTFGSDTLHGLTGKPPCTTPSFYKWLGQARRDPSLAPRVERFFDVHGFLAFHLTGRAVTSLAAADPTGFVDMRGRSWAADLVRYAGLPSQVLPELVEVGQRVGAVTVEAHERTGLPVGLPVFAGAGDGQAAGLGAGITGPGCAYMNLGTAVVSGVLSASYRVDRAFRTLFGATPDSYFLETDLQGGTFTVSWLCERLLGKSLAILGDLERDARSVAPGSDGLFLVPYWNGVMNPYWDASARGLVVGLSGEHGPAHLYRALLEGIAFEQRLHLEGVEAASGAVAEVVVMGGGSSSDLWCQILADVLDKPIVRASSREATALGAAMIASSAAGIHASACEAAGAMAGRGQRFVPGAATAAYRARYESTYRHLYPTLRPLFGGP